MAGKPSSPVGMTVAECQARMQKSFQNPKVRFLRQSLEKAGCPVRDNFFRAIVCDRPITGSYIPGHGIVLCSNHLRFQDEVTQVVIHELIHTLDDCRVANMNWNNCRHMACSEIRAGRLSGDCHFMRELLRGFMKLRGHESECIRRRVLKSMSVTKCAGSAKDDMEAVWDICYNDTEPFDKDH